MASVSKLNNTPWWEMNIGSCGNICHPQNKAVMNAFSDVNVHVHVLACLPLDSALLFWLRMFVTDDSAVSVKITTNCSWMCIFTIQIAQTLPFCVQWYPWKPSELYLIVRLQSFFPFHVDDMNQWPKWKFPKPCAKPIYSAQTLISLRWSLTFQLLVWG